jgi:hypothetical protein
MAEASTGHEILERIEGKSCTRKAARMDEPTGRLTLALADLE